MSIRFSRLAAGLLLLALAPGCHTLLRYRSVGPPKVDWPVENLAPSMNPYVLTGLTAKRLVVEVDWIAGSAPSEYALDALRATLAKYEPPGREFVVEHGEEIPATEWPAGAAKGYVDVTDIVDRHLTHDPRGPDEIVYVLYAPRFAGYFGITETWNVHRGDRIVPVQGCIVALGAARNQATLWITARKIERSTLVHEFGHVLGLIDNPSHEQAKDRRHCTHTECIMAHPRWRTYVANFWRGFFTGRMPWDYCKACQEDIRRAQAYWAARAAADAGYGAHLRAVREARDLITTASFKEWTDVDAAFALNRSAFELAPREATVAHSYARALILAGRVDEGLRVLRGPIDSKTGSEMNPTTLANALAAQGRYAEALAAFSDNDLQEMRRDADYWGFVARAWALTGAGRTREAAEWLLSFSSVRESMWHYRVRTRIAAAGLLRQAGDLPRAVAIIEEIEHAKQGGADVVAWSLGIARLERALGHGDRAVAVLLEEAARQEQWASDSTKRNSAALRPLNLAAAALAYALAGKADAARGALAAASAARQAGEDTAPYPDWATAVMRTRVLAVLGARAEALDELGRMSAQARAATEFDPCLDEDLATLRTDPGFAKAAPWCAAAK